MADIQTQLPVRISNGTDNVSIRNVGSDRGLLIDFEGLFFEDAAHASGDQGLFVLGVRNDTGASLTSDDGDYCPMAVDEFGNVKVNFAAGAVSIASDYDEDTAHTDGDKGSFMLAVRNDVQGALVDTDGDYAPLQVDALGRLRVVADTEITAFDYAEDTAHTTGDRGGFVLAVRNDADTSLVSATGDYSPFQTDANGRLKVAVMNTVTTTVSGTVDVSGSDVTVSGTVDVSGSDVSVTGLVDVEIQEIGTDLVHYYDTQASIVNAAVGTITYTVTTGKTLYLKSIIASSSGDPCKVTVDYGTGPTVVAVGFYATSSPFLQINFPQPIAIAAGEDINVKITNNSGSTQDVYATIMGREV